MIRIWGGDERGQEGSGLLQAVVSVFVCMLLAWRPGQRLPDHWTSPETTSPLPTDVQLISQVSLLGARGEELHQG